MPITVSLPSILRDRTKEWSIHVEASTLEEAIDQIDKRYPGFKTDVISANGAIRPSLFVLVNGIRVSDLNIPTPEGSKIEIERVIAGG